MIDVTFHKPFSAINRLIGLLIFPSDASRTQLPIVVDKARIALLEIVAGANFEMHVAFVAVFFRGIGKALTVPMNEVQM